jgi:two-component sensor histidine kinase
VTEILEIELPRERTCGAIARRAVEHHTAERLPPDALDDLKLVVTELVDNAYLHGEGRIRLKLDRGEASVRVEVIDEGEGAAIEVAQAPRRSGGHGLKIVDNLASSWGAFEGTTHVWAELPL